MKEHLEKKVDAPARRNLFREHGSGLPWCGRCYEKDLDKNNPLDLLCCTCFGRGILLSCTDSSTGNFELDGRTLDSERMENIKTFIQIIDGFEGVLNRPPEILWGLGVSKLRVKLDGGIIQSLTMTKDGRVLGIWTLPDWEAERKEQGKRFYEMTMRYAEAGYYGKRG